MIVQVFSNGRNKSIRIAAGHETYVHPGPGAGRDGMDRSGRVAAFKGQHLQRVPAVYFFGPTEAGLAPVGIDYGAFPPGYLQLGQGPFDGIRNTFGFEPVDQDTPPAISHRSDRVGQDDSRIGQQPAPVAGMMAAVSEI